MLLITVIVVAVNIIIIINNIIRKSLTSHQDSVTKQQQISYQQAVPTISDPNQSQTSENETILLYFALTVPKGWDFPTMPVKTSLYSLTKEFSSIHLSNIHWIPTMG